MGGIYRFKTTERKNKSWRIRRREQKKSPYTTAHTCIYSVHFLSSMSSSFSSFKFMSMFMHFMEILRAYWFYFGVLFSVSLSLCLSVLLSFLFVRFSFCITFESQEWTEMFCLARLRFTGYTLAGSLARRFFLFFLLVFSSIVILSSVASLDA